MKKYYDRVWATVDLDAIEKNMDSMKAHIRPETKLMAVIKTDGYGHGAIPIGKMLEEKDYVFGYATATAEEALILRKAGIQKPILILGYVFPYAYEDLIANDVRMALFREDQLEALEQAAEKMGKAAKAHVKVDTGMSRIGIRPDQSGVDFIQKALQYEHIELEGLFTHFASADCIDKSKAYKQKERYDWIREAVSSQLGYTFPIYHCGNSAAILEMPETSLTIMRAGITLYGLWPSEEMNRDNVPLFPALSLHSHIVYIKTLEKGREVSYGGTYILEDEKRVATIPVGYGDGYPRGLSNKGYVLIAGKKAPILGRVCMDQFMVDVTHIPEAKEGDVVTLIGSDGEHSITMEELGDLSGRFNYELACDLGKRIPRVYVKAQKEVYTKDYFEDTQLTIL